jgi:hypothetical protein
VPSCRAARSRSSACTNAWGQVAAHLALADVVLLGQEAGRPARHQEPAQHERAVGVAERALVGAEAVGVAGLALAAANSSSAAPSASSWNCALTRLPASAVPPG